MTKLLALQQALDSVRMTYDHVRSGLLDRLSSTAGELERTAVELRRSAERYDESDEGARHRFELWP
jgi:hypothetical protein